MNNNKGQTVSESNTVDNLKVMKHQWKSFKRSRQTTPEKKSHKPDQSSSKVSIEYNTNPYLRDITNIDETKSTKAKQGYYSSNGTLKSSGMQYNGHNSINQTKGTKMIRTEDVEIDIFEAKIDKDRIVRNLSNTNGYRDQGPIHVYDNMNTMKNGSSHREGVEYVERDIQATVDYDKVKKIVMELQTENETLKKKLASQKYEIRSMKKELHEYKKIAKEFKQMDPNSVNLNIHNDRLQADIKRQTNLLKSVPQFSKFAGSIESKENLMYIPPPKTTQQGCKDKDGKFARDCCVAHKKSNIKNNEMSFHELTDWIPADAKSLCFIYKKKFCPKARDEEVIEFVRKLNECFLLNEAKSIKKLEKENNKVMNKLKMKFQEVGNSKVGISNKIFEKKMKKKGFIEGSLWVIVKLSEDIKKMQKAVDQQTSTPPTKILLIKKQVRH